MNNVEVVIIGGWAQSAATYMSLAKALETGLSDEGSRTLGSGSAVRILPLESSAAALHHQLDRLAFEFKQSNTPVLWLGCSLGGLHLLQWLQQRPYSSINVLNEHAAIFGTNPLFCERRDGSWPGMPEAALKGMIEDLEHDQARTIRAFNVLQCSNLPASRRKAALKILSSASSSAPRQVLMEGLHLLKGVDLRPCVAASPVPLLALFGQLDPLTGSKVAMAVERLTANTTAIRPIATIKLLENGGHYPDDVTSAAIAAHCKVFLLEAFTPDRRLETHG